MYAEQYVLRPRVIVYYDLRGLIIVHCGEEKEESICFAPWMNFQALETVATVATDKATHSSRIPAFPLAATVAMYV
jgi:hypothetical protein